MSTQTTPATNGATSKAASTKPASAENPKAEVCNVVLKPAENLKPIHERIKRFEELEKLLEKREKIDEAIGNLNDFYIAPTGGAQIQLKDSRGNTFAIAHPSVIGEIVSILKNKLGGELAELDNQFIL